MISRDRSPAAPRVDAALALALLQIHLRDAKQWLRDREARDRFWLALAAALAAAALLDAAFHCRAAAGALPPFAEPTRHPLHDAHGGYGGGAAGEAARRRHARAQRGAVIAATACVLANVALRPVRPRGRSQRWFRNPRTHS